MVSANTATIEYQKNEKPVRNLRRLKVLQRIGHFTENTKGTTIKRAITFNELYAAYKIVHDIYVEEGYIQPQPSGLRIRPFEISHNTATFIAIKENDPVGVMSMIVDSNDLGLPSDELYHEEINLLRRRYSAISEASNNVILPYYRQSAITTEFVRCMMAQSLYINCDIVIASVNPGHKKFYQFIGFVVLGPKKNYSKTKYDPVILMYFSLKNLKERWGSVDNNEESAETFLKNYLITNNPYMSKVYIWDILSVREYINTQKVYEFYLRCPELFYNYKENELKAIKNYIGYTAFKKIQLKLNAIKKYSQFLPGCQDFWQSLY